MNSTIVLQNNLPTGAIFGPKYPCFVTFVSLNVSQAMREGILPPSP